MLLKLILILFSITAYTHPLQGTNEPGVVRAVLFYSPTCGHCQIVIRETILPLIEDYGEQFQIIGIDTTKPQGQILYEAAREYFNLEFRGVPFLVIGDEYLSGSVEIPEKLPDTVKKYMDQGGVDWPEIPGLQDAIYTSMTEQAPTPSPTSPTPTLSAASIPTPTPETGILEPPSPPDNSSFTQMDSNLTVWQKVMLDPAGNGLAIFVLLGMVSILILATFSPNTFPSIYKQIFIPILCILGLGVASYLAYVETTQTTAVCGPVGNCNTVQQSEYARLFGVIPIGIIGVIGYLSIIAGWGIGRINQETIKKLSKVTVFALSALGFTFSIYLTFLEPFVIGATCAWCLTSAVIMTSLFILTLKDARSIILET